ncbi:General secretion pathway protein D [Bradyrhizobium sp. ORS 375]|uniref:type II secretion system secretin GspD n=1 Tax=Bradyrhizobium sp. (strain ORS 375) TaxID=566679 RepID=UPI000240641E|nr:type II secretion system secretin GspD [Bradyrhizobium sp. ORS 375]CCD94823.1 General secretion pathway protein D [Bradyrhizobium sp. ORS 375]
MFRLGNRSHSAAVARHASVLAIAVLLASCNMATLNSQASAPADVDVIDKVRSLDILPRDNAPVGSIQGRTEAERASARIYQGTTVQEVADVRPLPAADGRGYDLNFENTPIAAVAKVVIGDILGAGYSIDPRVQGSVSLTSTRPVAKSDILFVLESALRLSGVVLVREGGGYKLTPLGDAIGGGRVDGEAGRAEPGYGVSVVPLQYVGAQTILKLMDSFATRAGSVRADPTRNLLLIQGTGPERRSAIETAQSFDVDWMRGQSVGVFPVSNSAPEPVVAELEKIMDSGENGLSQSLVKLQVISRLNAIMVVARKPALLQSAATWIRRLDQADSGRNSVHVYRIRYGDARQLARILTDMFGGAGSSASTESAESQTAPGSDGATNSVADRLSFNTGSSNSAANPSSRLQGASGLSGAASPSTSSASSTPTSTGLESRGGGTGGQSLMPNVRITPDTVNNSLLIYADRENYRIISSTLQQLDQPVLQVGIDATIAEVTLTNELSYGVQSYLSSKFLGLGTDRGSISNTQATSVATATASTAASALINRALPGFNFLIGSETSPNIILDALHTVTSVKVLSNPSLVVINNQTATLQVGDVVPVSTGSATVLSSSNTVVNTIDYRNTGIILRVVPRIAANGNVRLEVEQEISNVAATSASTLTPTVSQRKVKSAISVANGQTVLLAGLISEQQNGNRNGIPVFDEIPVLGDAFSHQGKKGTRTELIIFIRPQIIRDGSDAHQVAEELRSKLRGSVGAAITDELRVRTTR